MTNKVDDLGSTLFVYKYDSDSRLTNRWSAEKGNTYYSYDAVGNLTFVNYPTSPDITLSYDALNRLTNMVDAVGSSAYSYDAVGQVLSEDGPWVSDAVSYTYEDRLRKGLGLQAPNASDWSQTYVYDLARRLTNVTSQAGSFGYVLGAISPASSLIKRLSLQGGSYVTNDYDSVARQSFTWMVKSDDSVLNSHTYNYNLGSQRTQQVFTAGNKMNYTYDGIGQLLTAKGKESGGTSRPHEQFGYGYDAAGNLNWRTNNALVQQFKVNSLNELTNVNRTGTLTVAGTVTYEETSVTVSGTGLSSGAATLYSDLSWARAGATPADGNNTYTAVANDTYGRSSTDEVSVYSPASPNLQYDLNGNLTNDGWRAFSYDDENELTSVVVTNAWKSEFTYDGKMRRRVRKEYTWSGGAWLQTNEVRYVYDGNLVIQERDANNLPLVTFTRDSDLSKTLQAAGGIGGLLARTDHRLQAIGDVNAHAYYHCDGNGNITCMVNTNGLVVARYSYDPYGNVLGMSGPMAEANLYRFSSKEWHPNSGLVYYLYRCYAPDLHRWPNRDPKTEKGFETLRRLRHQFQGSSAATFRETNLYEFIRNNSVSGRDPFGLEIIWTPGDPLPLPVDNPRQNSIPSSVCQKLPPPPRCSKTYECDLFDESFEWWHLKTRCFYNCILDNDDPSGCSRGVGVSRRSFERMVDGPCPSTWNPTVTEPGRY